MKASVPHFLSDKTIIIAGAGIAGLSFTIALRKLWDESKYGPPPRLRIFERDTEATAIQREGHSLSLRSDNGAEGIQALQKLDLLDKMVAVSITGLQHKGCFALWDKEMKVLMKVTPRVPEGFPVGSMRIARNKLRNVMVQEVQHLGKEIEIEWGRWCVSVKQAESGKTWVILNDEETVECDILIAADGASSKIRSAVRPNDTLQFTGFTLIQASSKWNTAPPSPVDKDWGTVITGTGTSLFVSPVDNKTALWSLSWPNSTPQTSVKFPQEQRTIEEMLRLARDRGTHLPFLFQDMIEHTDRSTIWLMNAMDKPPFRHMVKIANPNIIFIGDANHAVSPFAGAGANMALLDGWDLAFSLCDEKSLDLAVNKYDQLAVPRAKKMLSMSHFNIRVAHSTAAMSWIYMRLIKLLYWAFLKKQVEMRT